MRESSRKSSLSKLRTIFCLVLSMWKAFSVTSCRFFVFFQNAGCQLRFRFFFLSLCWKYVLETRAILFVPKRFSNTPGVNVLHHKMLHLLSRDRGHHHSDNILQVCSEAAKCAWNQGRALLVTLYFKLTYRRDLSYKPELAYQHAPADERHHAFDCQILSDN